VPRHVHDGPLPRGARVRVLADAGGTQARANARVLDAAHPRYRVRFADGREQDLDRTELELEHPGEADALARRAAAWAKHQHHVVLEVVVGSQAWGLADASSDEDLRGCFVLPFEDHVGLEDPPHELSPPGGERQIWEIEKLIRLALRAEPGAFELLWSPLVRRVEPIGDRLRHAREIFVSQRVHGSFGRYALRQLDDLQRQLDRRRDEAALAALFAAEPDASEEEAIRELRAVGGDAQARERLRQVILAACDRGASASRTFEAMRAAAPALSTTPPRPKNAYNLIRLLHSGISLLRTGAPLIRVEDPALRARLLAIKAGEVPLTDILAEARGLGAAIDDALASSALPEAPDHAAATALLLDARAEAAHRFLSARGAAPAT
jgi:hypothetical protein